MIETARVLAVLLAVAPGARAESYALPVDSAVELGIGFDTATGEQRGHCLASGSAPKPIAQDSQARQFEAHVVRSRSDLRSQLETHASASLGLGGWGGSAEAKFVRSTEFNRFNVSSLITLLVANQMEPFGEARLRPQDLKLWKSSPREFRKKCGDTFVDGIATGGLLKAVLQVSTTSSKEQREVSKAVQVSAGPFASASAQLKQGLASLSQKYELSWWYSATGGSGPLPSTDQMFKDAQEFPDKVKANQGWRFRFSVKSYDTVANAPTGAAPLTDFVQKDTLDELAARQDQALGYLNDLRYVRAHSNAFQDFNPADVESSLKGLETYLAEVGQAARRCYRQSSDCAPQTLPEVPEVKIPSPKDEPPEAAPAKPVDKSCSNVSAAKSNVDWVLKRDKGAKQRYKQFLKFGLTPYEAVVAAQAHNPKVQRLLRRCVSVVSGYLIEQGR